MRHRLSSGLFFCALSRAANAVSHRCWSALSGLDSPGPEGGPGGSDVRGGLDLPDVGCLQTLRAAGHFELNPVTLGEALEAVRLDGGVVDEHVFATLLRDEPVALGVVEPLHLSLCHTSDLSLRGYP